jgi:hypothetical protein
VAWGGRDLEEEKNRLSDAHPLFLKKTIFKVILSLYPLLNFK